MGLPIGRSVRLRARDLLVYCNRGTSGAEYDALVKAFERLAGTRIKTDITTGKKRARQGFGLVESWSIVERTTSNRMASIDEAALLSRCPRQAPAVPGRSAESWIRSWLAGLASFVRFCTSAELTRALTETGLKVPVSDGL